MALRISNGGICDGPKTSLRVGLVCQRAPWARGAKWLTSPEEIEQAAANLACRQVALSMEASLGSISRPAGSGYI